MAFQAILNSWGFSWRCQGFEQAAYCEVVCGDGVYVAVACESVAVVWIRYGVC